jgi:hypothetical protein
MPTDITVTELKETVTVTGGTTSITVTGDSATVSVATTTQPVSVVQETSAFTINTVANKADIGLGNVDDTSDANKPVSSATQTALDAKLNKNGGTMTGALTLASDPTQNLQAATKGYVDSQVNAVPVILTTDDVAEGEINLYYTANRVNSAFDTRLATKSTTNLTEGSNLYHTTARARSSISATGSIAYNSTTGVISYTGGSNPTNTDELPEGTTNKYYTDSRVNSAFDTRLATKTTSNLNEGTNLYYTSSRANTDFDTRLATKSTTNLAEGTNLYYTSARSNSDFDGRLATKSTTNLTEGSNLYYTTARARSAVSGSTGITYTESTGAIAVDSTIATKTYADSAAASAAAAIVDSSPATLDTLNELAAALGDDPNFATTVSTALGNKLDAAGFSSAFDGQLAGKTTTNVAEGSNLYYTDARARAAISATGSISYNSTTGVISYTQPSYATVASTGAYSDLTGKPTLFSGAYADLSGKPTLFDGAYSSLSGKPTLFSGSYTDLTNKPTLFSGAYADLTNKPTLFSGAYADLTGKPTALSSFTNDTNYITTSGARSALSAGTGVSYNSSTGAISIGQAVGTTDNPTFGTVTANLTDGSKVLGSLQATTNTSYTFPPVALNTITNNNGLDAASSMSSGSSLGLGAQGQFTHYFGDTFAGGNTTAVFSFKTANGNSASSGTIPFTGVAVSTPSAVTSANTIGGLNFNGYATTGFTDYIGTQNQGGGSNAIHAGQIQFAPTETFADGTLTISGATITAVSRLNVTQTVTAVGGTRGQLTIPSTLAGVGQAVIVTGTDTNNVGIAPGTYYIVANNGGASNSTQITLGTSPGGAPITTTAGTPTGLTFTRQMIIVTYSAQSNIPFGQNAKVTISGFTNVTSGTYMLIGAGTTTTANIGAPSSAAPSLSGSQSISCPTITAGAAQLRVRAFPAATPLNSGNRVDLINHSAASATYRTDSFVIAGGAYGNTSAARVTVDSAKATFGLPVAYPSYTTTTRNALTPAAGWVIWNTTTVKLECYDGTAWQALF